MIGRGNRGLLRCWSCSVSWLRGPGSMSLLMKIHCTVHFCCLRYFKFIGLKNYIFIEFMRCELFFSNKKSSSFIDSTTKKVHITY